MAAPLAPAAPGVAVTGGQLFATIETSLGSMQFLAKQQEQAARDAAAKQDQMLREMAETKAQQDRELASIAQSLAKEQEQAARDAAQALKNALAGAHRRG